MGMKLKLDKHTFGIGFDLDAAYLRIQPIAYDVKQGMWDFLVKTYLNKESREFEKVSEFVCRNWGTMEAAPQQPKPEDMSDAVWDEICKFKTYNGNINGLVTYRRGVSNILLKTKDITDLKSLTSEMYQHMRKEEYVNAEDDLEDTPLEDLIAKYTPNLYSYVTQKEKNTKS